MKRHPFPIAFLLALTASPCSAAIIYAVGNTPGVITGNPDENVLAVGAGVVNGPGATVTGRTNQTDLLLDFTGTTDGSTSVGDFTYTGGQATLSRNGGGTFQSVTFTPNNFTDFDDFEVDLVFPNNNSAGTLDIFVTVGGSEIQVADDVLIQARGNNSRVRVQATMGEQFTQVRLVANASILQQIKQTRISAGGGLDGQDPPDDPDPPSPPPVSTPVPEPTSFFLWTLGGVAA